MLLQQPKEWDNSTHHLVIMKLTGYWNPLHTLQVLEERGEGFLNNFKIEFWPLLKVQGNKSSLFPAGMDVSGLKKITIALLFINMWTQHTVGSIARRLLVTLWELGKKPRHFTPNSNKSSIPGPHYGSIRQCTDTIQCLANQLWTQLKILRIILLRRKVMQNGYYILCAPMCYMLPSNVCTLSENHVCSS